MKFVILVVIVLAVIVWFQRLKRNLGQDRSPTGNPTFSDGGGTAAPAKPMQAEAMVSCDHCGIHFPASEAVTTPSGAVFCSAEHRQLHST